MSNYLEKTTTNYNTLMKLKQITRQNFFVEIGNYSVNFLGPDKAKKGQPKLITEERTFKTFAAAKMIIRDAKIAVKWNEIKGLTYETDNFGIVGGIENCYAPEIINIDIKNAYPTCLRNEKLISIQTFNYLSKLSKLDRLAAIGMCAKSSVIFEYEGGKLMDYEPVESETKNIFFHTLSTIQKLMVQAAGIAGEYYIYHWVDGIYLRPETPPGIITQIKALFLSLYYETTIEVYKDFICTRNGEDIKIQFITSVGRKKIFRFYDNNFDKNFKLLKKSLISKLTDNVKMKSII